MERTEITLRAATLAAALETTDTTTNAEEALVADARAGLTPAQMVERKFVGALRAGALFVSQLQRAARTGRPAPPGR
jgi:hypothetical protein